MHIDSPRTMVIDRKELASFDAIRGIAAIEVLFSHLRAFLFVNSPQVHHQSVADMTFYFVTGLGHQAVIAFFVLSGWLVGGSVWHQLQYRRFSWRRYATARLTRLWIVLIPALLFTTICDKLGERLSGGFGYDGSQLTASSSGPGGNNPISLTVTTFLGNLGFMQTIRVPVLGTNGPLWSLANEFWYYVLFPLLAVAWYQRKSVSALWYLAGSLLILLTLPIAIRSAFPIWLLGWAGSQIAPRIHAPVARPLILVSSILTIMAIVSSKRGLPISSDFVIGASLTGLLIGLRAAPSTLQHWGIPIATTYLAHISYTLYLFHFPMLALYFFSLHLPQRQPTGLLYADFLAIFLAVISISTFLWYIFERRTDAVRDFVDRTFARNAPGKS